MTREIKFRAWDKELKILHPVQDLQFGNNGKTHVFLALGEDVCSEGFAPEKFDLMQYTNLKDKNGEEIFEGDLLRVEQSPYGTYFGEVKWINFSWRFVYRSPYSGENQEQFLGVTGCREVIGNIFENPELLEAKND